MLWQLLHVQHVELWENILKPFFILIPSFRMKVSSCKVRNIALVNWDIYDSDLFAIVSLPSMFWTRLEFLALTIMDIRITNIELETSFILKFEMLALVIIIKVLF